MSGLPLIAIILLSPNASKANLSFFPSTIIIFSFNSSIIPTIFWACLSNIKCFFISLFMPFMSQYYYIIKDEGHPQCPFQLLSLPVHPPLLLEVLLSSFYALCLLPCGYLPLDSLKQRPHSLCSLWVSSHI